MKNFTSLFLTIILALSLSSCGNDTTETPKTELDVSSSNANVHIDENGLTGKVAFQPFGGEVEINVKTNLPEFSVSKPAASWLEIEQSTNKIIIRASENTSDDDLATEFTITAGAGASAKSVTITVTIEKYGSLYIKIDKPSVTLNQQGEAQEIAIETNGDSWSYKTESEWLTVVKSETGVTLSAEPNTTGEELTAEITITTTRGDDSESETIYVTQEPVYTMSLDTEQMVFNHKGNTYTVNVTTNGTEYVVGTPSESWLTAEKSGDKITLKATANTATENRKATVTVSVGSGENMVAKIITAHQYGDDPYMIKIQLTIPQDETMAVAPIYQDVNATVYWGDGAENQYTGNFFTDKQMAVHTYAKAGVYEVAIAGKVSAIYSDVMGDARDYLTAIFQWGKTGLTTMENALYFCQNLKTIPGDTEHSFENVTTFMNAFSFMKLESIPADLFKYAVNAENFIGTFQTDYSEPATLKSIPAGLFDNCVKALSFEKLFFGQNSVTSVPENLFAKNTQVFDFTETLRHMALTSVPENLFANNTAATLFRYTFSNNPLTSVPANLFKNNTAVTDFRYLFSRCDKLKSIPAELFKNNPAVTSFFSTFAWSGIETIPAGLFDNNTAVTDINYIFTECNSLKAVPDGLFAKMTKLTALNNAFYKCTALESVGSGLFNAPAVTAASYIFSGCTSLKTLPSGLFSTFTKAASLTDMFTDCTALETLPSQLLGGLSAASTISQIFMNCTALRDIPSDLFAGTGTTVKTLTNIFKGCTSLTSVPAGLFDSMTAITNIMGLFSGCTALESVPASIFDKNKRINTVNLAFENCSSWKGESPYSTYNGAKVHLYERRSTNGGFTSVLINTGCFRGCTSLDDYPTMEEIFNAWVK